MTPVTATVGRTTRLGRAVRRVVGAALGVALCLSTVGQVTAAPGEQSLRLFNIHTKERAEIVFRRNGRYVKSGLREINRFLRDWRQDEPTEMDPVLIDLVWDVYRRSGSKDYIHVVSGYRSPTTNGKLRRRSKGVAKNSLHMKGRAMDFYLPDVKLAKLRELGLKLQWGGVGYYPKSGAPFVHMDTGNVRHWPRMSRTELARVFPNGRTVHVPTDGKPLSGYAVAKAEIAKRKAGGSATALARVEPDAPLPSPSRAVAEGDPIVIASAPAVLPKRRVAVAVAAYDEEPTVPTPRLAPRRAQPTIAQDRPVSIARASLAPPPRLVEPDETPRAGRLVPGFDFGNAQEWAAPSVPANLAAAMAERDRSRSGASLPIAPTSVVATIDVSRPLRADAITSVVLRDAAPRGATPSLLAYAPPERPFQTRPAVDLTTTATITDTPVPRLDPRRFAAAPPTVGQRSIAPRKLFTAQPLTFTTLDTLGLRSWIGTASTRQRAFATLTMPDIGGADDLTAPPQYGFAGGFGSSAYPGLSTARFSGPLVREPGVIMLVSR